MSAHQPKPFVEILIAAEQLVEQLRPFCERIEIAGSIRRLRPACSDIEIVCEPLVGEARFPGELLPREGLLLDAHVSQMIVDGRATERVDKNGRRAFGPRYKRLQIGGVPVDLFSVIEPASWGVLFLLRTGPMEFSRRMVTQRSKGGVLPDQYRVVDGAVHGYGGRVEIADEAEYFALCNMKYIEPEERR